MRTFTPRTEVPPPVAADWFAPKGRQPFGHVFYVHGGSFVRLSFAGPTADITEALSRIGSWLR